MSRVHLLNNVASKVNIFASCMGNANWCDVGESLRLVDNSVGVWQVLPVLCSNLPVSNHPAQFLLNSC